MAQTIHVPHDGGRITIDYIGDTPLDAGPHLGDWDAHPAYMVTIEANGWGYSFDTHGPARGGKDYDGMTAAVLSFLGAAADAYSHWMRTGQESENYTLFPEHVTEWAYLMEDEIAMLALEHEEARS